MPVPTVSIALRYDAFGRLVLTDPEGREHPGVVPVRAFPFTTPTQWISFCDERGREVFCLSDLDSLTPTVRETLEADLAKREFIPVIERVESVSAGADPTDWNVLTDRGPTRFVLTSEDHIRRLGPHGALITDSHGIRYRILDDRILDSHSRRILRRYL